MEVPVSTIQGTYLAPVWSDKHSWNVFIILQIKNTGTSQGYLAKCPRSAKWHSDKTMERIYLKRPMFKK